MTETAAPTPTLLDPPVDPPLLPEDGLPTALASALAFASVWAELRTTIWPPATIVSPGVNQASERLKARLTAMAAATLTLCPLVWACGVALVPVVPVAPLALAVVSALLRSAATC